MGIHNVFPTQYGSQLRLSRPGTLFKQQQAVLRE
jgi:hypothetical protein